MASRGLRKKLVGKVIGDRMDKTALILVERLTRRGAYEKYVRRRSKYMANDPENQCNLGDTVRIVETRPLSKRKRWQVVEVVEKGHEEI